MENKQQIDYVQEVIERVDKEFNSFIAEVLKKTPEEIFYTNYEIHVKTEISDVILENCLDEDIYKLLYDFGEGLLGYLYNDFLSTEYASVNTYDDTEQFIIDSIKYWRETTGGNNNGNV